MSSGLPLGLEWALIDTPVTMESISHTIVTPPPGNIRVYAKQVAGVATLCYKKDNGVELCFTTAGGSITGSGAAGQVTFWTGASAIGGNNGLFWDNTNKRLGIGTSTPETGIQVKGAGPANTAITTERSDGLGNFSGYFVKGSATQNGDFLALFGGGGSHTGASANRAVTSFMGIFGAETWSSTAKGSYITFLTTPTGSTTATERFRFGPSGQLGIGGANFGTSGQVLTSQGAGSPPVWAAAGGGVSDHGALTGLVPDDDHTQYALLAGRSGGQTLKGGTGTTDSLNLVATAGVGTNDASIIGKVGNNGATQFFKASINSGFFIGNGASPGAGLSVATTGSAFSGGDWIAWFRRESDANPNESLIRHEHFSGGAIQTVPIFTGIAARGTVASPVAITTNDNLLILDGRGYDGSATDWGTGQIGVSDTSAQHAFVAGSLWSATNHESFQKFLTTPSGSTTPVERLRIASNGNIGHLGYANNPFAAWVGASDSDYSLVYDSFNSVSAATSASIVARRARGSQASPSAVSNGDSLFTFQARGYNGSDFPIAGGSVAFVATENWDGSNNGAGILLLYTRTGTNFMTSALQLVTPADGETAILVERNVGGTFSVQRVSMGAIDSGGSGFKLLRVPN